MAGPVRHSDPRRRIGNDLKNVPDVARSDEKIAVLEDVPPDVFSREPRAVRQSRKTLWSKTRKGRAK